MTTPTNSNSERPTIALGGLPLLIITLIALALRWGHLAAVAGTDLVKVPIVDAAFYHRWAEAVSRGEAFGSGVFFMSPLYPYLTGLIYALFGAAPVRMMLAQGLLGTAAVLLVYRWASGVAGRTVGLVTAAMAGLYAPFIFYDATLLTASLIVFLSAVILNLADDLFDRWSNPRAWLLGVVLGLSGLARPLALLFLPFLAVGFYLSDRLTFFKRAGTVAGGAALVLLPVAVRNLIVGGEFVLTTSSAGMNFYVGNNPDATGIYWEAPFLSSVEPEYEDEEYRRAASEALGIELTTRQAGKFWMNRALVWIVSDPVGYLALTAKKAFFFFNRAEFANNVSIYLGKALSPVLRLDPWGYWLAAPLGLAGLVLMWRRRGWKRCRTAWLFLMAYFTGCVVFFVSSEYRLPVVLPLLLGAGFLVTETVREFSAGRVEPGLKLAALGLVMLPIVNFRTGFIRSGENPRMDWFNLGNTHLKDGRFADAARCFERSLEVDPAFAEAMLRLAEARYRSGDTAGALEIGRRAGLPRPETVLDIIRGQAMQEAYRLLAEGKFGSAMREFTWAGMSDTAAAAETTRVVDLAKAQSAYQSGDFRKALEIYLRLNARDAAPDPMLLHNLALVYWELGQADSAEIYVRRALEADSLNYPAVRLAARILNATGRHEEADKLLRRFQPFQDPAHQALLSRVRTRMDSLAALGYYRMALEAYGEYGKLGYDVTAADKFRLGRLQLEIGNLETALRLLDEAEGEGYRDADLFYQRGRVLALQGRWAEAAAALQQAVGADPDHVGARVLLARIYLRDGSRQRAWDELQAVAHLEIHDPDLESQYRALVDSLKRY